MRKNLCANCKCAALEREVGRSVLRERRSRPSGGGFQGIRLYRSDAGGRSARRDIHADAKIVSRAQPSHPSARLHPCRARCCFIQQNHCTSHRDEGCDFWAVCRAPELALACGQVSDCYNTYRGGYHLLLFQVLW